MRNLSKLTNKVAITLALLASPFFFQTATVSATTNTSNVSISVPIDTYKIGAVGSVHELASKDVSSSHQGMVCVVNATARNQESVHPNNNLIVSSGSTSVELKDVERAGGILTTANGSLTLGSKVTVKLVLGQDGGFSGGLDVNISCEDPKIEICRDGKVMTINKKDKKPTDKDTPCVAPEISAAIVCSAVDGKPVYKLEAKKTRGDSNVTFSPENGKVLENGNQVIVTATYNDGNGTKTVKTTAPAVANCAPEKVNVCRDGKVLTINKTDRKDTDKDAPCPEVKAATTTLPNTGAGSLLGVFSATFIGGTALAQRHLRRKLSK